MRNCFIRLCTAKFYTHLFLLSVPGSSVGIATGRGLDGPGIESRWRRDFPHLSIRALGPTQPPLLWIPGFSWGKERPGRDADPSPLLVQWSWKGRAIPLLPQWAVRPVQSLSASTRVTFTFTFFLLKVTPWYGPTGPKHVKRLTEDNQGYLSVNFVMCWILVCVTDTRWCPKRGWTQKPSQRKSLSLSLRYFRCIKERYPS